MPVLQILWLDTKRLALAILLLGLCFALGLLLGYLPIVGLASLLGIPIAVFILIKTELGMLMSLFAIPFDRLAKLSPEGMITAAKVFLLLTLLGWGFKVILFKDREVLRCFFSNPVTLLGILFLIFSLLSFVNAQDQSVLLFQQLRRMNIVILYLLLIGIILEKGLFLKSLWTFLVASIFVSFLGIYELIAHTPVLSLVGVKAIKTEIPIISSGQIRILGASGDPDALSASMILPTALALMVVYLARQVWLKVLAGLSVVLFLVNILGTGSRGGTLGFLIALMTFWALIKMRKKWIIAGSVAFLLGVSILVIAYLFPSMPTARYTGESGTSTIVWRLNWMQMGFSIIKDHPFLGVGTGNFQSVYPRYLTAGAPHAPHFPHNSFLQIWIENGTLGFLVYLGLYLVAIKNLWTVIRTSKVRELETIAVALLGALFGLGFFALTANVLEHEVYWILFAFTVIVLNLHQRTGIQT